MRKSNIATFGVLDKLSSLVGWLCPPHKDKEVAKRMVTQPTVLK